MRPWTAAAFLAAVSIAWPLGAAGQPATDWGAVLTADAQALHDTFQASHPGAVDAENPAFRTALADGLARAKARAPAVNSYAGYRWAMREYVAGFDDGHVNVGETDKAPAIPLAWPGFLTRDQGGRQVVALRGDAGALPAIGAELVSCDGEPAARLLETNVGRYRGRWNLESQREAHAWRLFLDVGNPFVRRPAQCVFREGGREQVHALSWTPLSQKEFEAKAGAVSGVFRTGIEVRPFGDRGLWISAGTFTGADGEDGRKLEALVGRLTKDRAALAGARVVVLDVRGNGGGSSRWGRRIAEAIWGESNAEAAAPRSAGVDWRASDANIAELEAMKAGSAGGMVMRVWADNAISGMRRARAAGQSLWRETAPLGGLFGGRSREAGRIDPAKFVTRAPVYVLTDASCASACLDALDVWLKLGAIHVGRETSADSLYMEVRSQVLPSGFARLSVPMKVYRGRPRGLNEPYRPVHRIQAEMSDTPALEAQVLALAASRARTAQAR
jgi:hypothetical protein